MTFEEEIQRLKARSGKLAARIIEMFELLKEVLSLESFSKATLGSPRGHHTLAGIALVAELETARIETDIVKTSNLYKIPTRDLVNELRRREGVQAFVIAPYDTAKLTLLEAVTTNPDGELMSKPVQEEEITGPCVLVKVLD